MWDITYSTKKKKKKLCIQQEINNLIYMNIDYIGDSDWNKEMFEMLSKCLTAWKHLN